MNIQTFITDLAHRGVTLSLDSDRLIAVPGSLLVSKDADQLRTNKPAIVAFLTSTGATRRPRPLRSHCVTCEAGLTAVSMIRCPACVDNAYRERSARWAAEGRGPP